MKYIASFFSSPTKFSFSPPPLMHISTTRYVFKNHSLVGRIYNMYEGTMQEYVTNHPSFDFPKNIQIPTVIYAYHVAPFPDNIPFAVLLSEII